MKTLKFNPNNITIDTDIQAVADVAKNVVQTLQSELILNQDGGLPYLNVIWSGTPEIEKIKSIIASAIEEVDNVLQVESLDAFVKNNILSYNATIKTTFGSVKIGL